MPVHSGHSFNQRLEENVSLPQSTCIMRGLASIYLLNGRRQEKDRFLEV